MKNPMLYGKAKGIVLLQKYLPKYNPFKKIDIINSIDEWNSVKNNYGDFVTQRVDTLIGDPRPLEISGTNGFTDSIPELIEEVKRQNPDGVVLLMSTKEKSIPRYENDGGFNVLFNIGNDIIIELVGKGFDAHELTREKAVHESYKIPWNEVLFMRNRHDLMKSSIVQKNFVPPDEYKKNREERIKFLRDDCHYDIDQIEKNIPQEYKLIDDEILQSILDDIVLELIKKQSSLRADGLGSFGIQGNLVHGKIQPWEIFRAERIITKNIER